MSTYLQPWSAWVEVSGNTYNFTPTIPAGTDRVLCLEEVWQRDERNFTPMDWSAKLGGADPLRRDVYKTDNRVHVNRTCFKDADLSGNIVSTAGANDRVFYRYCVVENVSQTDPFPGTAYANAQSFLSGQDFPSLTLAGTADEAQSMTFVHGGTDNRSYSDIGTPPWGSLVRTQVSTGSKFVFCHDEDASGGNTGYLLRQSVADTQPSLLTVCQFADAVVPGPSVSSVNGDDVVRRDYVEQEEKDDRNRVFGSNLDQITGIVMVSAGVELAQEDFEVISSSELAFSTNMGSFTYGAVDLRFEGDPTGDFTQAVSLAPGENSSYGTIAGYPPAEGRSLWDEIPGATNGRQYEWDLYDQGGRDVAVAPSGTVSVAALGTQTSLFTTRVHTAANGGQWTDDELVTVNAGNVIIDVDGATESQGDVPADAQDVVITVANVGDAQGKVYMMEPRDDDQPLERDGTEVEQTVGSWVRAPDLESIQYPRMYRVTLTGLTFGSLPLGVRKAFLVEPA